MRGGKRAGAGRKTKAEELKVAIIAQDSIVKKFGSLEAGFEWLLETGEVSLIRFAFEHAVGKPLDKVEHSGDLGITWNEVRKYGTKPEADRST